MGKIYDYKNIRLVALVKRDFTFIGYDIVEIETDPIVLLGTKRAPKCVSVFDETKAYPYTVDLEICGNITAINSQHMNYNENTLRVIDGKILEESLKSFVSEMGTDIQGTFYFPNYKGDKVKKYGDCWSK